MQFLRTSHYGISPDPDPDQIGVEQYIWGLEPWVRLKFCPKDLPAWIGAFGTSGLRTGCTRAIALNSPRKCCIIADGQTYVVDLLEPDKSVILPVADIVGTAGGPPESVLVLISFANLVGVLDDGSWWRSPRLASDGIRNVQIHDKTITGEGWQAHSNAWAPFSIDCRTGNPTELRGPG